jgi:hydroxymethylglutaryl-CoA lyase
MSLSVPDEVSVVEMLPRDGFQNFDEFVDTEAKVEIIDALSTTGVDEIEITSFTHPKAVPNLRDAETVAEQIERHDDVTYRALVPNAVGMERAIDAGVEKVNALVVVSEEYSRRNQNMTLAESLDQLAEIVAMGEDAGIAVEAGIGTSFFGPYEGSIPQERTLSVIERALELDVDEVTLATTMGMASPRDVDEMLTAVYDRWPDIDCGLHLHDTNGMSLANTLVAMENGVDRFDTSVCGLGGGVVLPEELQGVGNTPTEDLTNMLRDVRVATDVDFDRLTEVARKVSERLGIGNTSHVLKGGTPEFVLGATRGSG